MNRTVSIPGIEDEAVLDGGVTNFSNTSLVSSNVSSTADSGPSEVVRVSMLCTLTVTGAITVLMNVFVLAVVWRYSWMRTNANLIIASMAVTDLIAGLSAVTSGLVKWGDFFTVSAQFCVVYNVIDITVAFASLQHVLAVNLERYLAIIKPLQYKKLFQRYKLYLYIVGLWLWSLGLTLMYVLNMVLLDKCLQDIPKNPVWTFTSLIFNYPIPLIVISGIYIHIVIVIVKQLRFLRDNSSGNARIKSKQFKMIKSVASIFAAYLVCWAPTFCVLLAVSLSLILDADLDFSNFVTMFYFVEVLSYVNSLVNPFIYFLGSRSFQKAARMMFHMKERQPKTEDTTLTTRRTYLEQSDADVEQDQEVVAGQKGQCSINKINGTTITHQGQTSKQTVRKGVLATVSGQIKDETVSKQGLNEVSEVSDLGQNGMKTVSARNDVSMSPNSEAKSEQDDIGRTTKEEDETCAAESVTSLSPEHMMKLDHGNQSVHRSSHAQAQEQHTLPTRDQKDVETTNSQTQRYLYREPLENLTNVCTRL